MRRLKYNLQSLLDATKYIWTNYLLPALQVWQWMFHISLMNVLNSIVFIYDKCWLIWFVKNAQHSHNGFVFYPHPCQLYSQAFKWKSHECQVGEMFYLRSVASTSFLRITMRETIFIGRVANLPHFCDCWKKADFFLQTQCLNTTFCNATERSAVWTSPGNWEKKYSLTFPNVSFSNKSHLWLLLLSNICAVASMDL